MTFRLPVLFFLACMGARLASAAPMAWEGTVSITGLTPLPLEAPVTGVATVIDNGNGFTLQTLRPLGTAGGTGTFLVTDPETPTVAAIRLEAHVGFGTLAPFDPLAAPTVSQLTKMALPIGGVIKVCLISTSCASFIPYPLNSFSYEAGVGVGGVVTYGGGGTLRVSVQAAPWTVRDATLTVQTTSGASFEVFTEGYVHGPFSFTGSTATTGGEVSLVTPMVIRTNQSVADQVAFARLTIRFIPEPSGPLLLGSGLGGLWVLQRHRLARRRRATRPSVRHGDDR